MSDRNFSAPRIFGSLVCQFLWLACGYTMSCEGSERTAVDAVDETAYRRVFVPAELPESWPVGDERYLPVPKAEFMELREQSLQPYSGIPPLPVRFGRAAYRAELQSDELLVGSADIEVLKSSGEARWLSLEPLNLVITSAVWNSNPEKPATMGLFRQGEQPNQRGVLVAQPNMLATEWQLRPKASDSYKIQYLFKTPISVPQTLELLLPKDFSAVVSYGKKMGHETITDGQNRWTFQLAPNENHSIEILRQLGSIPRHALPRASQSTDYRIESQGLSMVSQVRLDARRSNASDFRFSLSEGICVVSAMSDHAQVEWRIEQADNGAVLVVKRPKSELPQLLEVRGIGDLQLDRVWRLPTIRPRDVFWTEGSTSVYLSPELELKSMQLDQGDLKHIVGIMGEDAVGEAYRIQQWSADASVDVLVSYDTPRLGVRGVTTIELGKKEATARTSTHIICKGNTTFAIDAELNREWSIDAVSTFPAAALQEWHIIHSSDRVFVRIQLAQPISLGKALQVRFDLRAISGQNLLPANIDKLRPLQFVGAVVERECVSLRSRAGNQAALLHGLEEMRLSSNVVDPLRDSLGIDGEEGVWIDLMQLDSEQLVELGSRAPDYRTNLSVEITALPNAFRHHYTVDCTPISGDISELLVTFEEPLPANARWSTLGDRFIVASERIDQSTDSRGAATYRLNMIEPQGEPFRLETSYLSHEVKTVNCNLMSLPETSEWHGHIVVLGPPGSLRIGDRGWIPIMGPQLATTTSQLSVLGCYRLDSRAVERSIQSDRLVLDRSTKPVESGGLIAWLAEYRTMQSVEGPAIHYATYFIENPGESGVEIVLPPDSSLQDVWIDQEPISDLLVENQSNDLRLDPQQCWTTVTLKFWTDGHPLGSSSTITAALPKCSFPINLHRWSVWTPQQFHVAHGQNQLLGTGWQWRERLFGPLARDSREGLFNPFQGVSWNRLWASTLDANRNNEFAEPIHATVRDPLSPILHVEPWVRFPQLEESPWSPMEPLSQVELGRFAGTFEFADVPPSLALRKTDSQRALWYSCWLVSVVVGIWKLAAKPEKLLAALVVAAWLCLVFPWDWLMVPQATFLGLLTAFALQIVFKKLGSSTVRQPIYFPITGIAKTTVLMAGLLSASSSHAAPIEPLPQILTPIDAEGNVQGEDVYVPERFLKRLREIPVVSPNRDLRYAILEARYVGSLSPAQVDPESDSTFDTTVPWSITFRIESFVRNCRVTLPLRREDAMWLSGRHRLDGVEMNLDWHTDGHSCSLRLPEPGSHLLELVAQLRTRIDSDVSKVALQIPPVPVASLDLSLPESIRDLEIGEGGAIDLDRSGHQLRTSLQTTDVLKLTWKSQSVANITRFGETLQFLSWLHIGPSTSKLDVQLILDAAEQMPSVLRLKTGPQLKVMPPGENSLVKSIEISPTQPEMLTLKLKEALSGEVQIPLQFTLNRSIALGQTQFPWVQIIGIQPNRSLFAVTVASGLSFDEEYTGDVFSVAAKEFTELWKTTKEKPLYAYSLGRAQPNWSLRVWPDPKTFSAQQLLRLKCQPGVAKVTYEATLSELTGSWLMHRVSIPRELHVDEISLHVHGKIEHVPLRWSRMNGKELVVFIGQPINSPHRIVLRGTLVTDKDGEFATPKISLIGAGRGEVQVLLYRKESVLVDWVDPENAPERVPQQSVTRTNGDILVGQFLWRVTDSDQPQRLRIEKNDVRFEVASLTTLQQQPEGWNSTIHVKVKTLSGLLSQVRIAAPENFHGPFQLQPTEAGIIGEVKDFGGGRLISLLLSEPVKPNHPLDLQLTGSVDPRANRQLDFPNLSIPAATRRDAFVVLPTRVDGEPISWNTHGLEYQQLPAQWVDLVTSDGTLSFRVRESQFTARERSSVGQLRYAVFKSAFISAFLDSQTNLIASVTMILQPARATECAIRLPLYSRLTRLTVGGRIVRRELQMDGSWKIPLGPPYMPQLITVYYITVPGKFGNQVQLTIPEVLIGDQVLPDPIIRGHFCTARDLSFRIEEECHTTAEVLTKEIYSDFLQTMKEASSQALELPTDEGRWWFYDWRRQTLRAESAWRRLSFPGSTLEEPSPSETLDDRFDESEEAWRKMVAHFGSASARSQNPSETKIYPPQFPSNSVKSLLSSGVFFQSTLPGQLTLHIEPANRLSLWQWFCAIALFCLCATGILRLRDLRHWFERLCDWTHAISLILGLTWWLMLRPSALGLLIVAVTLVSLTLRRLQYLRRERKAPAPSLP